MALNAATLFDAAPTKIVRLHPGRVVKGRRLQAAASSRPAASLSHAWKRLVSSVADKLLRRRVRLEKTPLSRFSVRVACTVADYVTALALLRKADSSAGPGPAGCASAALLNHAMGETTILVAYEGTTLVSTMAVVSDSPAGLPLDQTHWHELNALRRSGARLAELGSMAVIAPCRDSGVANLMIMAAFHLARRTLGATHLVMGAHRRALPFFRAVFGFARLEEIPTARTKTSQGVVLVQELVAMPEFFSRHYRHAMASGRQPYFHFVVAPPACVQIPIILKGVDLARWRMPRSFYQSIFRRASCHQDYSRASFSMSHDQRRRSIDSRAELPTRPG